MRTRIGVVIIGFAFGCGPGGGTEAKRLITGTVFDPLMGLPLQLEEEHVPLTDLMEASKIEGPIVCRDGDDLSCSMPSGPMGYSISVPKDKDAKIILYAKGAAETDPFIPTYEAKELPFGLLDLPNKTMNVLRGGALLNAAAVKAGLAQAGDAQAYKKLLEKGGGLIFSQELVEGTTLEFVRDAIDLDVTGAAQVYAVTHDAAVTENEGYVLVDLETANPDAIYPLAALIYVGDGTMGMISVTATDVAKKEMIPLEYETVTFANRPGAMYFHRLAITNLGSMLH